MAVLFTSDLHIGHKNICKYRGRFTSTDQHDEYMLSKILELGKRDLLIILGDFVFDSPKYLEHIEKLRGAPCRIQLIMGNHDSLKLLQEDFIEHREALASYKNFWLSHCPIHPSEMRKRIGNIHGHLHSDYVKRRGRNIFDCGPDVVRDERYYNFNRISAEIYNRTLEAFKPTPLIITDVALGKLDYPDVIDRAIESAAKRELEIKQAEADVQVRLTELKGKEQVAKGEYRIKMQEAKRIRDYNRMIADGITPELLRLREIEVQEAMVTAIQKGTSTVFVPYEAMGTAGANMRMFQK